jgi:hypothetical protein
VFVDAWQQFEDHLQGEVRQGQVSRGYAVAFYTLQLHCFRPEDQLLQVGVVALEQLQKLAGDFRPELAVAVVDFQVLLQSGD